MYCTLGRAGQGRAEQGRAGTENAEQQLSQHRSPAGIMLQAASSVTFTEKIQLSILHA